MWVVASWSLVAVDDPAAGQVIRREFDDYSVRRKDADVVLPHLATDRGQDLMTIGQLNAKHRIGQGLDHGALQLECAFFLCHRLSNLIPRTPHRPAKVGQPRSLRQDSSVPKSRDYCNAS